MDQLVYSLYKIIFSYVFVCCDNCQIIYDSTTVIKRKYNKHPL